MMMKWFTKGIKQYQRSESVLESGVLYRLDNKKYYHPIINQKREYSLYTFHASERTTFGHIHKFKRWNNRDRCLVGMNKRGIASKKKKEIEEIYQKKSPVEHVLERPDTYVGSLSKVSKYQFVAKKIHNKHLQSEHLQKVESISKGIDSYHWSIFPKMISFVPALYRITDELIVNAVDNHNRKDRGTDVVKFEISDCFVPLDGIEPKSNKKYSDKMNKDLEKILKNLNLKNENGWIHIYNNGKSVPVSVHKKENLYVPELVFGHLLTGSNFDDNELKYTGGRNGYGAKCISPNTLIPLFTGDMKKACDITLEDTLIGDDGNIRNIKKMIRGKGKMYEVVQANGESYKVNDQHILTLHMPSHKNISWDKTNNAWSVSWWNNEDKCINTKSIAVDKKTSTKSNPNSIEANRILKQLQEYCKRIDESNTFDISIQDFMKLNETTKKRLEGLRGECVLWSRRETKLDPYLFGLCLSDEASTLKIKSKEPDLKNKKYIPREYMVNNRETRLKLLAGIIDADKSASVDKTEISISKELQQKRLVYDVLFLARSLGFYCSLRVCKTVGENEIKDGEFYKINISGSIEEIPTKNLRKIHSDCLTKSHKSTGSIEIKDVGVSDYVGFEIDSNQRFLINDFTVTHNCANIFSSCFVVRIFDSKRSKCYLQVWDSNMKNCSTPIIHDCQGEITDGIAISMLPDYDRFELSDGILNSKQKAITNLLYRRMFDVAACNNNLNVFIGNEKLNIQSFEEYVEMFYFHNKSKYVHQKIDDNWEIAIGEPFEIEEDSQETNGKQDKSLSGNSNMLSHFSFVNSIATVQGGTHVNFMQNQISKKILNFIQSNAKSQSEKLRSLPIQSSHIQQNLFVWINCKVQNPTFDSQTKETLTTKMNQFDSKCDIPGSLIQKLSSQTNIIDNIVSFSMYKYKRQADKPMRKSLKLEKEIASISKLQDANFAGTSKSSDCSLILTEGESSKSLAIAGLSVIGRDKYGVFPLKGKLLNVRECSKQQLEKNQEIQQLKLILGLKDHLVYDETNINTLRYRKVILMCDQDFDGSHIKGLFINFIETLYPSLLKMNFIEEFVTPIIRVSPLSKTSQFLKHNRKEMKNDSISFFTVYEFEQWRNQVIEKYGLSELRKWKIKYYKGLGTSTVQEAKEYFKNIEKHKIEFRTENEEEDINSIVLAFAKDKADARKEWLSELKEGTFADHSSGYMTFTDFINKELILFSQYNNIRAIPSVVDGLKPSQRKVLYCCFKRKLNDEIKVAQLAGYVSEHSAYHHGEASLHSIITNMAQDFVGSNNIPLLYPSGQFGTRLQGGKDAASPRYIFTRLNKITRFIFREEDDDILEYNEEDGQKIEPKFYLPIVPLILINGTEGMGTGYSTTIPSYNPTEIIEILFELLENGGKMSNRKFKLKVYSNGYKGEIVSASQGAKFITRGKVEVTEGKKYIRITELPLKKWTEDYKEHLIKLMNEKNENGKLTVKSFTEHHTDREVDFKVYTNPKPDELLDEYFENELEDLLMKTFKLESSVSVGNMNMFDENGQMKKFKSAEDVIECFYWMRLKYYSKRKEHVLNRLNREKNVLSNKSKFFELITKREIDITLMKKEQIIEELKQRGIETEDEINGIEREKMGTLNYDYLLNISILSISKDNIARVNEQLEKKNTSINELEVLKPEQLWKNDLTELKSQLIQLETNK